MANVKSIEKKLETVNAKISKKQAEVDALVEQKSALESLLEEEELKKLRDLIISSGKTVDEVAQMLK